MSRVRVELALALLCILIVPTVASAQSDDVYTRYGGWRDRFNINAGAFFVGHDTFALLRPSGTQIPGINVESDTAIGDSTTDFRLDGYFRLGKRHRLLFGYIEMRRDAVTRLDGEIEWDDKVFPVDAQVASFWDTRVLSFQYRFSLFKSERVDFGVSAGLFVMRVKSGIALGDSVADVSTDVSEQFPLPMLGAGLEWEFARGFVLRARGQYLGISIQDTLDGNWGEAAASIEWYPFEGFRRLGIGAGYNYTNIDVELEFGEILRRDFEYKYEFRGPVVYGVLTF